MTHLKSYIASVEDLDIGGNIVLKVHVVFVEKICGKFNFYRLHVEHERVD